MIREIFFCDESLSIGTKLYRCLLVNRDGSPNVGIPTSDISEVVVDSIHITDADTQIHVTGPLESMTVREDEYAKSGYSRTVEGAIRKAEDNLKSAVARWDREHFEKLMLFRKCSSDLISLNLMVKSGSYEKEQKKKSRKR